MIDKNIGFIGLGNLGKNLANSIQVGDFNLFVHDLEKEKANNLIKEGAKWCENIKSLVDQCTVILICLPSPKAISLVMESSNGLIDNINSKHLIIECSTTDEEELIRLSKLAWPRDVLEGGFQVTQRGLRPCSKQTKVCQVLSFPPLTGIRQS